MNDPKANGIPVDGHVHVYDCFSPARFMNAALSNFKTQCPWLRDATGVVGVLLLTEARDVDFYASLQGRPGRASLEPWCVEPTGDPDAVVLARDGVQLVLCAGRQLATAERLEVLALLTDASFEEQRSLPDTIRAVHDAGGVPVIPWGFGKWLARRGRILREAMEDWRSMGRRVILGDNGNRPRWASPPSLFNTAQKWGGLILPGSDPLPFRSHEDRGGTYGFLLRGAADWEHPASSLREYLAASGDRVTVFGRRVGFPRFMKDQLALHIKQRLLD